MKDHLHKVIVILSLLFSTTFVASGQERIVGGENASIREYPWQAALVTSSGFGYCGASVISDQWILTAAHCVLGDDASSVFVRVGAEDAYAEGGTTYSVTEIIVHPYYDSSSNANDIALIKISGIIEFSSKVQPIALMSPEQSELQGHGVIATTTGWGTLYSEGPSPNILQTVDLPIVANDIACGAAVDANGNLGAYLCNELDSSMICAGFIGEGGKDACEGDSGGPLVVRNANDTDWLLIGTTSWGYGCAEPNYPGVWARVSFFFDWLNDYTNLYDETNTWFYSDYGCIDTLACNFDASATIDDGGCMEFDECGECGGYGPDAGFDCDGYCTAGTELTVNMMDSYGDGWNGSTLTIGEFMVTLSSGFEGTATICVDMSQCHLIHVDAGLYPEEISWSIGGYSGEAPYSGLFGACDNEIIGCIDTLACNFDASATIDDGGCMEFDECGECGGYGPDAGFDCDGSYNYNYPTDLGVLSCGSSLSTNVDTISAHGYESYDDPQAYSAYSFEIINDSTFIELSYEMNVWDCWYYCFSEAFVLLFENDTLINIWDAYEETGGAYMGSSIPSDMSLDPGAYTLVYGNYGYDMSISEGMGIQEVVGQFSTTSNDNEHFTFQMEMMAYDGTCDYPGCTDATALNFNPIATADDGSCNYPTDLGVLSCGSSLSTNVDTISAHGYESYDDPQAYSAYSFEIINDSTFIELSYEMNVWDCWYYCFSDAFVLLFENDTLINIWDAYEEAEGVYMGSSIPSYMSLDPGAYTLVYGNYGYDMSISEGMGLQEVVGQFSTTSNDNEHFTFQMEIMAYDGTCDYPGCTDATALNYNPEAIADDGSCEYLTILGELACGGIVTGSTSDAPNNFGGESPEHIYSFEISYVTNVEFSTCNSNYDTWIRIYQENMSNEIYSCDDCGPCDDLTVANIFLEPGSYFILLEGYAEGSGAYEMSMQCSYVYGCTEEIACNYNSLANIDDGSCYHSISSSVQNYTLDHPFVNVTSDIEDVTYEWYLGGELIEGFTSDTIVPLQNGSYFVVVYDNSCSGTTEFTVATVDINELTEIPMNLYPNPSDNFITIDFESNYDDVQLEVFNSFGKLVLSKTVDKVYAKNSIVITVNMLPTGLYVLKATFDGRYSISPWVKK